MEGIVNFPLQVGDEEGNSSVKSSGPSSPSQSLWHKVEEIKTTTIGTPNSVADNTLKVKHGIGILKLSHFSKKRALSSFET